ncbi:hypothetical protein HK101_004922, partial [Irineochytrium annulatum]
MVDMGVGFPALERVKLHGFMRVDCAGVWGRVMHIDTRDVGWYWPDQTAGGPSLFANPAPLLETMRVAFTDNATGCVQLSRSVIDLATGVPVAALSRVLHDRTLTPSLTRAQVYIRRRARLVTRQEYDVVSGVEIRADAGGVLSSAG